MIENTEEGLSGKEHRELFGETEILHILIIVVRTEVVFVKTHQNVHLKWGAFDHM